MTTSLRLLLLLALGGLLAGVRMSAAIGPNHVVFYTEPNFQGEALTVEAGASVEDLSAMSRPSLKPWIFAISSVQINGAARAVVYTGTRYQGDRLELTASVPDLFAAKRADGGTFDRAIASVQVIGPTPPAAPPAVVEVPARGPSPVAVVTRPAPPPPPVRRIDLRAVDASIHRAYREVLGRSADPLGLRTYRQRILEQGWTEEQVIRQLQRSDEARAVDSTAAITQAYRDVLGRDPDPAGLAHYRARWRDGWTQGQIRDDLRRSREGRDRHVRGAITRAYRDLLGREPDPEGYANYERLMRDRGYSEQDVRRSLMNSEEYRQRRR